MSEFSLLTQPITEPKSFGFGLTDISGEIVKGPSSDELDEPSDEADSFVTSSPPEPNGVNSKRRRQRGGRPTKEGKDMPVSDLCTPTNERPLDKAVAEYEKSRSITLTDADRKSMREVLRLTVLYPGEHVAFRDHYKGNGDSLRLVRREVLCHSKELSTIQNFINNLPEAEQDDVCMDFVESKSRQRSR